MIPGVDPKVDYAFRKLFASPGHSDLLVDLLNAVLNPAPDHRIASVEILTPFNEKDTETDKETILDIKARDQLGRQYNVEMEMSAGRTFPQRALYYWAQLHAAQLKMGEPYAELRPTISICFVNRTLFPQVPDYHLDFQLRSSRHPQLVFCPHQSMHILDLPKFQRKAEELVDPLDAWCYFLKNGETLDLDHLPAPLARSAVPKAMEVLKMLTQSEMDWHRYQSEVRAKRDRLNDVIEARMVGDLIGRIQAYQEILKQPLTPREELLAAPTLELLQEKAAALKREVASRITA
jgi:predicted transposase/invertase (TIGR01784 family)